MTKTAFPECAVICNREGDFEMVARSKHFSLPKAPVSAPDEFTIRLKSCDQGWKLSITIQKRAHRVRPIVMRTITTDILLALQIVSATVLEEEEAYATSKL
jgi:hypothetical protein